jgi:hypothetical protein
MILKMNEALIKQVILARVKNHDLISKGTGIDKSTVSLHLSSKRQISVDHAKEYAKFLKVPLIKVLDDNIVKYRVVRYVDDSGVVMPPSEDDDHLVIVPNSIEKRKSSKVIYHIDRDLVYWYSSDKNCENFDIINHPCYIKTKDKAYLGIVLSHNPKTHNITFADIQPKFKEHKVKATHCYPITSLSYLKYTTAIKIDNSL